MIIERGKHIHLFIGICIGLGPAKPIFSLLNSTIPALRAAVGGRSALFNGPRSAYRRKMGEFFRAE
jgi:hypothetical protein